MHTKLTTVATTLLLALGASLPEAHARGRSETATATVESSSLPASGSEIRWGRARTVVHATPEKVVAVLHDYAGYSALFPEFNASRILASRGHEALVYMEARVAYDTFTLWGNLRMSSREDAGARVIEAQLKRGNVNQFHAIWTVRALEGGEACEVEFRLLVDPNMKLPNSVISSENVKAAKRALLALQKHASRES